MNGDNKDDVLKFWTDYEATARTGKRAALSAKILGAEVGPVPETQAAAWSMISPHVADDYILVDPYGYPVGKDHLETMIKTGVGVFLEFERGEHNVRTYGDTAVYVSLVALKGERQGVDVSGQYRETHVLQKREFGWLVISSHMTKVDPSHGKAHKD